MIVLWLSGRKYNQNAENYQEIRSIMSLQTPILPASHELYIINSSQRIQKKYTVSLEIYTES